MGKSERKLSDEKGTDISFTTNEINTHTQLLGILKKSGEGRTSTPHRHIVFNKFHEISDGNGNLKKMELNDTLNIDYDETSLAHNSFLKSGPNSPVHSVDDMNICYSSSPTNDDSGGGIAEIDFEHFLKKTGKEKYDDLEWINSEDIESPDTSDMVPPPLSFFELDDDTSDGDENKQQIDAIYHSQS